MPPILPRPASAEERADRRYKQLKDKGVSVNLDTLLREVVRAHELPVRHKGLTLEIHSSELTVLTDRRLTTRVLANLMYDWMFRGGGDFGKGAAIAVVIMVMVIPIMIWNIRNARREMEGH